MWTVSFTVITCYNTNIFIIHTEWQSGTGNPTRAVGKRTNSAWKGEAAPELHGPTPSYHIPAGGQGHHSCEGGKTA